MGGDYVIEFESEDERTEYINSLPNVWSRESYASELNEAHNALFRKHYTAKDYLSMAEITLWVGDETYGAEAQALIDWWKSTCHIVAEYTENLTKDLMDIEDFIDSLPKFKE